jgi:4'-phosphopantetheinyl transferase
MFVPEWRPARPQPAILPAVIDIWRIHLAAGADPRADARDAMRWILAGYLACPPETLVFARRDGGKPVLTEPQPGLQFNLSHTRGLALLAVVLGMEVGIDVEHIRALRHRDAIARRVLPDDATADLLARPEEQRDRIFLGHWTAMEARQKAVGRGIFDPRARPGDIVAHGFEPAPGWLAHVAHRADAPAQHYRYLDYLQP